MQWIFTLYVSMGIFGILVIILDLLFSFGDAADAEDADGVDDFDSDGDDSEEDNGSIFHYRDGDRIRDRTGKNVLRILALLRNFVYFSAGFGGMGFFAMLANKTPLQTLYWSIPFGVLVLLLVRLLKRIQRSTLDSQIHPSQFLMSQAEVIVKMEKGQMGKVRIRIGGGINDYFARSSDSTESIEVGELVRIIEVTGDQVIVEKE